MKENEIKGFDFIKNYTNDLFVFTLGSQSTILINNLQIPYQRAFKTDETYSFVIIITDTADIYKDDITSFLINNKNRYGTVYIFDLCISTNWEIHSRQWKFYNIIKPGNLTYEIVISNIINFFKSHVLACGILCYDANDFGWFLRSGTFINGIKTNNIKKILGQLLYKFTSYSLGVNIKEEHDENITELNINNVIKEIGYLINKTNNDFKFQINRWNNESEYILLFTFGGINKNKKLIDKINKKIKS